MHDILEDSSVSVFEQTSTQPSGPPRVIYSQSLGTTEIVTC